MLQYFYFRIFDACRLGLYVRKMKLVILTILNSNLWTLVLISKEKSNYRAERPVIYDWQTEDIACMFADSTSNFNFLTVQS